MTVKSLDREVHRFNFLLPNSLHRKTGISTLDCFFSPVYAIDQKADDDTNYAVFCCRFPFEVSGKTQNQSLH